MLRPSNATSFLTSMNKWLSSAFRQYFSIPFWLTQNNHLEAISCSVFCWIWQLFWLDRSNLRAGIFKNASRLQFMTVLNGPTLTMPTQTSDNGFISVNTAERRYKFNRNLSSHKLALTVKCSQLGCHFER